jgi:hypothetical protein
MMPTTHSVDDEWESKCTEQQKDSKNHRRQLMPRHDLDLPLQQPRSSQSEQKGNGGNTPS